MRWVCVFCGSSVGTRPEHAEAARRFGAALAGRGLGLVYGAGHVGLMGVLADAVLAGVGEVVGVIPQALVDRELAHGRLTELLVVETMHQRKALMADRADAFAALPGGFGTADELFEILTWAQLGLHAKPVGLLNVAGFFDPSWPGPNTRCPRGSFGLSTWNCLRLRQTRRACWTRSRGTNRAPKFRNGSALKTADRLPPAPPRLMGNSRGRGSDAAPPGFASPP